MEKRSKGEGSLIQIYGKKDPATGEKPLLSQNWFASYYDLNGKQVRVSTGTPIKQKALVFLRKALAERDSGHAPTVNTRKFRYANLREGLLDDYTRRGNKSLMTDAGGNETVPGLKQLDDFMNYSADNPGPAVAAITTELARRFAKDRLEEGISTAWINRSLACLRRMLYVAREESKLSVVPKIRFLKEPPARSGFLEPEKFGELVALLPTNLRPLVTFLYYCGVRTGEARQIDWTQVDLDARVIELERDQTKNQEARTIPLPSEVVMMLRAVTPKTGKVFDSTNLRVEWEKACTAAGLGTRVLIPAKDEHSFPWYKYEGLLLHDLRRSAVRNMVTLAKVPERIAMKISGHKTRAVFDRYHIVSTDDVTAAMNRLEVSLSESTVKASRKSRREIISESLVKVSRSPRPRKLVSAGK